MRMPNDKELSGLGRADLLKLIKSLHDELKQIDDLLFDVDWDVEHQIECHASTLPAYTRSIVETLKKIDTVGDDRREAEMDALESKG